MASLAMASRLALRSARTVIAPGGLDTASCWTAPADSGVTSSSTIRQVPPGSTRIRMVMLRSRSLTAAAARITAGTAFPARPGTRSLRATGREVTVMFTLRTLQA